MKKTFEASVIIKADTNIPKKVRYSFASSLSRFAARQLNGRGALEHGEIPAGNVLFLQITAKMCEQDELRALIDRFFRSNPRKFISFCTEFRHQQQAISNRCERQNR